jgi:hypothetical protein
MSVRLGAAALVGPSGGTLWWWSLMASVGFGSDLRSGLAAEGVVDPSLHCGATASRSDHRSVVPHQRYEHSFTRVRFADGRNERLEHAGLAQRQISRSTARSPTESSRAGTVRTAVLR